MHCFLTFKKSVRTTAMSYAQSIIARLGGVRPTARLVGLTPSAVMHWSNRRRIPSQWHQRLMQAARQRGVILRPDDFFDLPSSGAE